MNPIVQAPVDLMAVLMAGALNPVVYVVAFLMGRKADQWQKIPVAGFAAATIGSAVVYVMVRLGLLGMSNTGRAAAGIFIVEMLAGMVAAALAYLLPRR